MTVASSIQQLPLAVAIHVTFALVALALGPVALIARKGSRLHRTAGYVWVTVMLGAAVSSLFLFDHARPNLLGYGPLHLLTLATFLGIGSGIWHILNRRVARHKRAMLITYLAGCVGAGSFALMPGRFLGDLVWHTALGLV